MIQPQTYGGKTNSSINLDEKTIQKFNKPLTESEAIIGFKGFKKKADGTLYCRDLEYKLGETYVLANEPKVCSVGFHFCRSLVDVDSHYSLDDKNHEFYVVRAWGKIDEDQDKMASTHLKLMDKVTEKDIFMARIAPTMEKVDAIMAEIPNACISGSLALILMGWIPYRMINDIDITVPYFGNIGNATVSERFGESGEETIKMVLNGQHFDLFVNPTIPYCTLTVAGKKYKVIDAKPIIQAKFKYLMKGKMKHAQDLTAIFETMEEKGYSSSMFLTNYNKFASSLSKSSVDEVFNAKLKEEYGLNKVKNESRDIDFDDFEF